VQEVWDRLSAEGNQPDIIIGADTVVSMDGRLYGKPNKEDKAIEMLKE
jgi:predicted house-cleaning NTP pyrophosphatase (Maf/HAM1 superfamily)